MRTLLVASFLVMLAACSSGPQAGTTSVPGHGALSVEVIPNPIRAKRVNTSSFQFPFEVVVRETGGHPVNIARVTVRVWGPGRAFVLGEETWTAEQIRATGAPTSIPANGEVRIQLSPTRSVPDERLFNGVSAELATQALDDTNTETQASTVVTVIAP